VRGGSGPAGIFARAPRPAGDFARFWGVLGRFRGVFRANTTKNSRLIAPKKSRFSGQTKIKLVDLSRIKNIC
jgi:hypothetical protein